MPVILIFGCLCRGGKRPVWGTSFGRGNPNACGPALCYNNPMNSEQVYDAH